MSTRSETRHPARRRNRRHSFRQRGARAVTQQAGGRRVARRTPAARLRGTVTGGGHARATIRRRLEAALSARVDTRKLPGPAWLWQGQRGISIPEYALLLAVIAVGTAGILSLLRGTIVAVFTNINNTLLPYTGAG